MPTIISTDTVAPEQRIDYWHRQVREAFGIEYRVEPCGNAPFSATMTRCTAGPVSISEFATTPFRTRRSGAPGLDQAFALVQIEGGCTVRHAGLECELESGSVCLCSSRQAAEFEFHGAARYFVIGVPEQRLAAHCPDWKKLLAAPICCGGGEAALFLENLQSIWRHADAMDGPRGKTITECTIALLGSALAAAAGSLQLAGSRMEVFHKERIRRFVLSDLSNSELDVPTIARAVGLSPRYVHRLFAGEPLHLMQWVWAQRLEHCYRDLIQDRAAKRPIGDIAYAWGFNDPAHFSRVFRKHFGVAPRQARGQSAVPALQNPLFA